MSKNRRRVAQSQRQQRGSLRGLAVVGALVVAVVAAAAVGVLLLSGGGGGGIPGDELHAAPVDNYPYPVEMYDDEAPAPSDSSNPRHIAVGEGAYATDPPTSGAHVGQLVQAGMSELVTPDEVLVHNMEHGYVIVWFNCNAQPILSTEECATLRNDLTRVIQRAVADRGHVVGTPDTSMSHHIALTAWQFMDAFDEFDEERVQTFIDTFDCHYDVENTCS